MKIGSKKWTFCKTCNCTRWTIVLANYKVKCKVCESEFTLQHSKKLCREIKRADRIDKEYLSWVRSLSCCVPLCKNKDIHCHHVIPVSQLGTDRNTVPLCMDHHRSYHDVAGNVERFEIFWGVNLLDIMKRLNEYYDSLKIDKKKAPN